MMVIMMSKYNNLMSKLNKTKHVSTAIEIFIYICIPFLICSNGLLFIASISGALLGIIVLIKNDKTQQKIMKEIKNED